MAVEENKYKVKLVHNIRSASKNISERVVFDVTPDLIENRNVSYRTLEPSHMPGNFQVYQNTSSRTFSLSNIKLVSRTTEEASINYARLQLLRGWTLPYFGTGTQYDKSPAAYVDANGNPTKKLGKDVIRFDSSGNRGLKFTASNAFGAPPPVLLLSAYAKDSKVGHLKGIPVVIQQLSIPYPNDADYIQTSDGVPFPTVMVLDIQLLESRSAREYSTFSLQKYKEGTLENF